MYCFFRDLIKIFLLPFYKLEVIGKENIKEEGSVIFAANHSSNLDPFMIGFSIKREIRFLGKIELMDVFFLRYIMKLIKLIPVDRKKNDIVALKSCIRALKEENALGIFPEGTRVKVGEPSENKAGIGLIAIKSGASIQPITIKSNYKLFSKVKVIIHPLYTPEQKDKYISSDYEKISNDVMNIIKEQ
ncbi:MAG: lysophospholipid acyltransferase family protein [Filifactoraceae bacterium]